MDGTVTAALSPEEKPLIENMLSLLQQLMAMQGEGQVSEETAPVMEQLPGMEELPEEEETAQKSVIDETGDTKAEDRLDNQTEITDMGLSDLKKTMAQLTSLLGKKRTVKKSINDPVLIELKKMNQTLQGVVKSIQDQEAFNTEIMNAIGFSNDMVTKSLESPKKTENKPIQGQDMALFAKELVTQLVKNMNNNNQNQNPDYQHPFNQKRRYDQESNVDKDMCKVVDFICRKGA